MLIVVGILSFILSCVLMWVHPATAAIILSLLAAILTLLGRKHRKLLYLGIVMMITAAFAQGLATIRTERRNEHAQDTLNKVVTQLEQARKENTEASKEVKRLQHDLLDKTKSNEALSRDLAVAQTRMLETTTGGSSFCYVKLFFERITHASLYVLHAGVNPVSDLEIRVTDVKVAQSERAAHAMLPSPEFFRVGTLPVRDIRQVGRIQLPRGRDGAYHFEFSARNGIWSQNTIVRRTANGHWTSLSQVFERHPKIVKFAELKKLEKLSPVCMERDQDFPTNSEDEVLRWFGGRTLPRCADVIGFRR